MRAYTTNTKQFLLPFITLGPYDRPSERDVEPEPLE